jgi:hypothetical protein
MQPDDLIGHENPYAAPKVQAAPVRPEPLPTHGINLAVENPFRTIWTRPRATIRGIVDTNPTLHVIPLAMIGGAIQSLDNAATRNAGDRLALPAILIMAIAGGSIGGVIGLYVGGWLLQVAGKWLGGRAEPEGVRAAIAWSTVPVVATIPIWLVQLGIAGHEMFTSQTPTLDANPGLWLVLLASFLVETVLGVWAFVLVLKCLGEVQRFSAWRALGSILLLALVIVVPLLVLALLVIGSRG